MDRWEGYFSLKENINWWSLSLEGRGNNWIPACASVTKYFALIKIRPDNFNLNPGGRETPLSFPPFPGRVNSSGNPCGAEEILLTTSLPLFPLRQAQDRLSPRAERGTIYKEKYI
jgi:hypothetical protein